jgi:hypothetical protein
VRQALGAWGYTLQTPAQSSLRLALCEVFLTIKSPRLGDITLEALATLRQTIASSHASLRGSLMQLSRALVGLGILAEPLNPWAMNGESTTTRPGRGRVPKNGADDAEEMPIAPEWITCVERWCATSAVAQSAKCVRLAAAHGRSLGHRDVRPRRSAGPVDTRHGGRRRGHDSAQASR